MHGVVWCIQVVSVIDARSPQLKAMLYCMGVAKLFVLELGPLLTVSEPSSLASSI